MKAILDLFVIFDLNDKMTLTMFFFPPEYCFLYHFKIDFLNCFYPDDCTVDEMNLAFTYYRISSHK